MRLRRGGDEDAGGAAEREKREAPKRRREARKRRRSKPKLTALRPRWPGRRHAPSAGVEKAAARRRRDSAKRAAKAPTSLVRAAGSAATGLIGIVREMLVWLTRIWLGVAEVAGALVLALWRLSVMPLVALCLLVGRAAVRIGEREATPARGLAVVALAATVALGASQFVDYRAVEVGAADYAGVENVAPAPQVDQRTPSSAHGASVFAIAVASLFVTVFAVARNWRLARLLVFLGAAVVVISLVVDLHQGLREGNAGIAYQGAKAVLLGGFWVQLSAAATLVAVGPLLAVQLRAARDTRRGRRTPAARGRAGAVARRLRSARRSRVEGAAT